MFSISPRPCRFHPEERAATCRDCYDHALYQQRQQRIEEQLRAHEAYLYNSRHKERQRV